MAETPIGRIGCAICYDWLFPEAIRQLAMNGAEVLVRVSAVDSTGRMLATTGLSGDMGAFREEVGQDERFRTFPLGAVVVTPLRPPPPLTRGSQRCRTRPSR